ncbi:MAG: glutamine amidotransferase [Deltaproteobacteria bacterium]|jgi:GMP synthase (glutamine-hydrolysing)|nr:glutamine amidotransferase [Deltaproteobacteria bacterium]
MLKPVLILKCGAVPKRMSLEDFATMFLKTAGLKDGQARVVDATLRRTLPEPLDFSAAMVTGSLSMVTAQPAWSLRLSRWLEKALADEFPVLGICYGHQLMAQVMGGRVGFHPGGLEIGTFDVHLAPQGAAHPVFEGLPPSFPANMAHSQSVLEPPPGATVLGKSDHDPCQILAYRPKALSFQFHPEFDRRIMAAFLATIRPPYRATTGRPPGLVKAPARDTPEAAHLLKSFLAIFG